MTRVSRFVLAGFVAAGLLAGSGTASATECDPNDVDRNCKACDSLGNCSFCSVHHGIWGGGLDWHVCVPYYEQ